MSMRVLYEAIDLSLKSKMMTIQQHRKNKRGLQQLSDSQKMEAITKVQKGETKAAVAREFGVPESTLRGWCKKAKLNGHCHSVLNKSLQVTSTMSPVLLTPEMAYRDCSYSKGSGSDEGSTTHPFSDEQEDEDIKPAVVVIPEEQRRVLDWLNYGHYPQLPTQTPLTTDNKPAQPVVTSSTCDDIIKSVPKMQKPYRRHNKTKHQQNSNLKNVGFYNWCKSNASCEGYSSPVSPISPASSERNNDSNDDEPLALIVPSKRRLSDLETSIKTELYKMYNDRKSITSSNINNNNNNHINSNNNLINGNNNVTNGYNCHHNAKNNNDVNNKNKNIVNITNNNNNGSSVKQTMSVEEALQHGEVFLDWLRECSDPNVTVLQAMQIGTLIKNLRSRVEKNQNRP